MLFYFLYCLYCNYFGLSRIPQVRAAVLQQGWLDSKVGHHWGMGTCCKYTWWPLQPAVDLSALTNHWPQHLSSNHLLWCLVNSPVQTYQNCATHERLLRQAVGHCHCECITTLTSIYIFRLLTIKMTKSVSVSSVTMFSSHLQ